MTQKILLRQSSRIESQFEIKQGIGEFVK